ncbi:MAG TPA: MSMEG_0565 family glycosyltransferase [Janthinobacterium sp.]|nr:MSMEG_0565 family glycosyltransferase [Janthinobacterium sp.]
MPAETTPATSAEAPAPARRPLQPLRIALLTHSTNPRGGVVHALELGDALHAAGHDVTVHAPDPQRRGLFRATRCAYAAVRADACAGDLAALVRQRIGEYLAWFERPRTPRYDVYHAQDSISANALAMLAERGAIPGYVRTVHHLDHFDDPLLAAWQTRGFMRAGRVLCVSRLWRDSLLADYGVAAEVVGNGVDAARFSPYADDRDAALRARLGLGRGPVFLVVGGVEPRKNTLAIFQAFLRIRRAAPGAQLVIAGGASLLDHGACRLAFEAALAASGLATGAGQPVLLLDRVEDADMPALYRCASALVFASLREGFGLAVLEAMACGTPAVLSRIAPFTEYLGGADCAWVDPHDPAAIAAGMAQACDPAAAAALREAGLGVSRRFTWAASAARHLDIYRAFLATSLENYHA